MLIGRDGQIKRILDAVEDLATPGGANVLFVTGEAGIGKSTLLAGVREAAAALASPPMVALAECSTPLAGQDIGEVESLEPWGRIMAALVTGRPERAGETRKLVQDLAVAWIRVVPIFGDVIESLYDSTRILKGHFGKKESEAPAAAANQQQIFQQYINFLEKLSERGPLVIMLDDFHWADTASSNLLFAAARQLEPRPVLFIIAYRPDDAASSRSGEGHPIIHVRNELERYSLVIDISVPKMSLDDVDDLIRHRYPAYTSNPGFEAWLTKVSGGNALFITEFLHTLEHDGMFDASTGLVGDGFQNIRVPASAHAVLQERVRRLSEDARELLRYASVEGDIFTSAVISKITETPALKLLQKLRLLEENHRVIRALGKQRVYAGETSAYQFAHVLMHKALYEDLGEEERELLHEAVLDVLQGEWENALAEGANVEGMAARLAAHAAVLGRHSFAAEVLLIGARATWQEFAVEESLRLLEGAIDSIDRITRPKPSEANAVETTRHESLMLRAEILRTVGRHEESLAAARDARAAAERLGNERGIGIALVAEAIAMHLGGAVEAAERAAREELSRTDHPTPRFDALTLLGHLSADKGHFTDALDFYQQALEVASEANLAPAKVAAAYDNLGCTADSLGRYQEADTWYRKGLEVATAARNMLTEAKLRLNLGVLLFRVGRAAEARESLEKSLAVFKSVGDRWNEMAVEVNLGILELHAGGTQTAISRYDHALAIARALNDRRGIASCLINLGEAEAKLGDADSATRHFTESLALNEELGDLEGRAVASLNLAQVHARVRPEESERFALQAQELASAAGISEIEAIADGLIGLAHLNDSDDATRALAADQIARCVATLKDLGSIYAEEWEGIANGSGVER